MYFILSRSEQLLAVPSPSGTTNISNISLSLTTLTPSFVLQVTETLRQKPIKILQGNTGIRIQSSATNRFSHGTACLEVRVTDLYKESVRTAQ
jgi:hypothetical protein